MSTTAQIDANQANAKRSTGPKTEAGKAASSQNNFRHGLAGAFVLQPWEKEEDYDELRLQLRNEYQPSTPTESLLVETMAKHFWLGQRAMNLQELCFHERAPMLHPDSEKNFALYLRYQATHQRAFHKCLNDLLKLRAQDTRNLRALEAQNRAAAAEARKQEMHEGKLEAARAKTELDRAKAAARTTASHKLDYASPQLKSVLKQTLTEIAADFEAQSRPQAA